MSKSGAVIKAGVKSEKQQAAEDRTRAAASGSPSSELPPSLKAVFSDIFKLIDEKSYKRAIKTADTLLKRVPTHGPTSAFKALALYNLGAARKAEAFDLAKAALRMDIKCARVQSGEERGEGRAAGGRHAAY